MATAPATDQEISRLSPEKDSFWHAVRSSVEILHLLSYYDVLNIERTASIAVIDEAYYATARVYHPDAQVQSPDRASRKALVRLFARIGEAHRVLCDPTKRALYDQLLVRGVNRLTADSLEAPQQRSNTRQRDPASEKAWALFALATKLADLGDMDGAHTQLELALHIEPESDAIVAAIKSITRRAEVEAPPVPRSEEAAEWIEERLGEMLLTPAVEIEIPLMGGRSKRQRQRHDVRIAVAVSCDSWQEPETLYTRDISRGGMFIATASILPVDTRLQLKLVLNGQVLPLSAVVRQVIGGASPGLGVEFVDLDSDTRAELEIMLLSQGVDMSTPPPIPD